MKLVLLILMAPFLMGYSTSLDVLEKWGPQVLEIHSEGSLGSAFAVKIGKRKVLVSAAHVCRHHDVDKEGKKYMSTRYKGVNYTLKVIKFFKAADICFLQYPKNIPTFDIADRVEKNEKVYALGYTLRDVSKEVFVFQGRFKNKADYIEHSFDEYIVKNCNKINKRWKLENRKQKTLFGDVQSMSCHSVEDVYVTSTPGSGGISGGPLLNGDGEVVGINMVTIGRLNLLSVVPGYEIIRYFKNKDKLK